MKAFFKAVIQIKYTENEEKTDYKQLKQYLIENNLINEEFGIQIHCALEV